MNGRRPAALRVVTSLLVLLALLLRLHASAIMPLAMSLPAVTPASSATPAGSEAYGRFVAAFGADAFVCAAMPGAAAEHAPARDDPDPGHRQDCAVCPLCIGVRDGTTAVLPTPLPSLPQPALFAGPAVPLPDDSHLPRRQVTPARSRAPPAL